MPASKKGEVSKRREAEWRKELKEDIELLIKAKDSIKNKLDDGDSLRDQDLRFLDHYPDILRRLREKQVEVKEEVLPEGKLKEWVENNYRLQAILKANNYPEGKEGLLKVLDEFHYYVCEICGYYHSIGKECPFVTLEKEHNKDNEDKGDNEDNEL